MVRGAGVGFGVTHPRDRPLMREMYKHTCLCNLIQTSGPPGAEFYREEFTAVGKVITYMLLSTQVVVPLSLTS